MQMKHFYTLFLKCQVQSLHPIRRFVSVMDLFNKRYVFLSICLFLCVHFSAYAQMATLRGTLTDAETGEALISATIKATDNGAITDIDGTYQFQLKAGTQTIEFSYIGYETIKQTVTLNTGETKQIDLALRTASTILQTATVTSGKFEKPLSEVTVSLEVIKPTLVENTNSTSVDEVLDKVPGVNIIDGQANIRGGSGYSYGAGSRVLLLIDDIPILQPDAGFPNWDDVPVENIEQIEVVKGAASALYGSSALNGIINIRTGYAKSEPETKVSTFYKYYFDPADKSQIWWDKQPRGFGGSVAHRQKFGKFDLTLGGYYLNDEDHNQETFDKYGRVNVGTRYRVNDKLAIGFNSNFNKKESGSFFFWAGADSLALQYNGDTSTLSRGNSLRYNIDPFVTYFDEKGNRHKLLGRYYAIDNQNNNNRSNQSSTYYTEYQYQKQMEDIDLVATAGVVLQGTDISAQLYGDTTFTSNNLAAYLQVDKKLFGRLNLSGGFRYERNQLNNPGYSYLEGVSVIDVLPSNETEARPVFRIGANYKVTDFTFLRASWGQGYRFPTVAEKFITTNFGVPISPNPALQSETGWTTEIGVKQGFQVGSFEGFVDVSYFWSEYDDMMEFTFVNLFPTGFRSENVGDTQIKGLEISIAGRGKLFGLPTTLLTGYNYIDPKFKLFDTTPIEFGVTPTEGQKNATNSSVDYNILKYRYKHSLKFDIETQIKKFTIGLAAIYNSEMEAVDTIFEFIVPGLQGFRETHGAYDTYSARIAYQLTEKAKLSLIMNNILNEEYSVRPGLLEAPRNFTIKADYKF